MRPSSPLISNFRNVISATRNHPELHAELSRNLHHNLPLFLNDFFNPQIAAALGLLSFAVLPAIRGDQPGGRSPSREADPSPVVIAGAGTACRSAAARSKTASPKYQSNNSEFLMLSDLCKSQ